MKIARIAIYLLALMTGVGFAQEGDARLDASNFCAAPAIPFDPSALMAPGEYKVMAQHARVTRDRDAVFTGDVSLFSDTALIDAQWVSITQGGQLVTANGDVTYRDPQLFVTSDTLSIDGIEKQLDLQNTEYLLTEISGRGEAEFISVAEQQGIRLTNVSFSTCPLGNNDWQIKADEISLSNDSKWGEARKTRFYVSDVPVFYLPYFAFPVTNERQSGLLFPEITSTTPTGLDISQPFYWNIAPNYDLTLTPRFMSRRGVQLGSEFRYLGQDNVGEVQLEYLPTDTALPNGESRYFYRWRHIGLLADNWLANVEINGISDDNYVVDFGSRHFNRADAYLNRTASLQYFSDKLSATARIRDFTSIGNTLNTYRALPELSAEYRDQFSDIAELTVVSELSYFDSNDGISPTAVRAHIAPTLTLPYRQAWGEVLAETTLFNTHYRQNRIEDTPLDASVTRTIPQARLFARLFFEGEQTWQGKTSSVLLEPTVQYLFTGFRDQSNIGLFDSTPLLVDVEGLFRGQEFSGLDRINDNNQFTVAMTARVLDESDREQLVVSLGQIFFLERSRLAAALNEIERSAVAAEVDWRMGKRWLLNTDFQLTSENNKVQRSSVTLEYRVSAESLVQLSHRYVRNLSGETIEQVGLSASWPIRENWQWVGRNVRDINRHRSLESYFGLQYESCCWSARLVAQRQISNRFAFGGEQLTDEFDSGIAFQFMFKGMGGQRPRPNMLQEGMFGYRQPYSLQ